MTVSYRGPADRASRRCNYWTPGTHEWTIPTGRGDGSLRSATPKAPQRPTGVARRTRTTTCRRVNKLTGGRRRPSPDRRPAHLAGSMSRRRRARPDRSAARRIPRTSPTTSRHLLDRSRSRIGSQGGRRRKRRNPLLDRAAEGERGRRPLILKIKEAQASVLEPHLGRSAYKNHARRSSRASGSCRPPATFPGMDPRRDPGVDYYRPTCGT